jgi:hypothetical protein
VMSLACVSARGSTSSSFFFLLNIYYSRPLFSSLNLSLSHHGAKARERFLFLAHFLDGVDFAQRQFEVQTKQRLFQARFFCLQVFAQHVPILIDFFASLHSSLRSPSQVSSFKFQLPPDLKP